MPAAAKTFSSLRQKCKHKDNRPNAYRRGYGRRWQKASGAFLAKHPLCECDECRKRGRIRPAEVTDHIVPHKGDLKLFWDEDNWQAMSKRCHNRKTAKENGGYGNVSR